MPVWIRVVCTQSVGHLGVADLRRASQAADFVTWAENQGLAEAAGTHAAQSLRFDGPSNEFKTARLLYGPGDQAIAIQRLTDAPAQAELKTLRGELLGLADSGARRIDEVLARAVEVVRFELEATDAFGMGKPICWQTAMWLGNLGKGLVDANGEWWDPESYEVIRSSL